MPETELIAGRQKRVFMKHGQWYTRKGYDCKVKLADKFAKKTNFLGVSESYTIELLIDSYCMATGWEDRVKVPPVMETDNREHIKQAVRNVVEMDRVTIQGF